MRYRVAALSAAQVANLFSSARVVPARGHSLFSPALDDVPAADTGIFAASVILKS